MWKLQFMKNKIKIKVNPNFCLSNEYTTIGEKEIIFFFISILRVLIYVRI